MKHLIKYIWAFIAVLMMNACTDLDIPVENELTPENFPKSEEQLIQASGSIYRILRQRFCVSYWYLQTLSTDEAILPARSGNWYDGARFQQLHMHTWDPANVQIYQTWNWGFSIISTCNQVLALFELSSESISKNQIAAEVRGIRALAMFMMMDLYGNIPVNVSFGSNVQPEQKERKEVFSFLERELLEIAPLLSDQTGIETYGRPTRYLAYAILAKMYLNAEVYTGDDRYQDAVAMCDEIISSGKYNLEADFKGMFAADNGPEIKEFIFAIPYDWSQGAGQQFTWFGLHYALQDKYNLSFLIDGPVSTLPEYYANFDEPQDARTQAWLTGKQYDNDGNPIIIKTTKKGLDASYQGADGSAPVDYHLEFTPEVTLVNPALFDAGGDELGRAKGYRNIKYSPDVNAVARDASNDVPVFRYADILLMKAEAILRGAQPTGGETALSLVNSVREIRNASILSAISLSEILRERAREFAWETWRRNDLIRFGKFEEPWGHKTDASSYRRLYPIPASEMVLNPQLKQNAGY